MAKEKSQSWDFGGLTITGEEVQYWQNEIKLGRDFKKKFFCDEENKTGKAYDCLNYYLGKQSILNEAIDTPIVDNQIAPIVNSFTASLLFQNPEIIVKERRDPLFPYSSQITKAVFTYFMTELKMEWHNQQCLFDAFITGLGVKINGYNTDIEVSEEKEKIKERIQKKKGKGKKAEVIEEEIEKEITKRREWITKEFPSNLRHSPFMTIVDPRSTSSFPYDGKWIDLWYEVPFNEVKGNEVFKNTEELNPTGAIGTDKDNINYDDTKKGLVRIHQIQISKKDGLYILTLAEGYEQPLRYIKFPFELEGFLSTFLTLNDTCDSFYAPSDIERLLPLQDEINYIQSRILEAIYKFLPKIGINTENIKDEQEFLNACEKGDIGTIIKFTKEPNASAQVMQFTLNLQDKTATLNTLKQEMRLISGVTEAELTGSTDARTATEANIGARGFSARIIAKREKLRRFLKEDLRKFKQIVQQAADFELVAKITGLNEVDPVTGERVTETWVKLNRVKDYVIGEYDLDLDITTAQQPNQEMKRRQIMESANFLFSPIVQQNLALQKMKIDYELLAREFLRTMDQFREAPNLVKPLSPQEQKQMMMNQMMQNGGPGQMANAPQNMGASQMMGPAESAGEMVAGVLGAGV